MEHWWSEIDDGILRCLHEAGGAMTPADRWFAASDRYRALAEQHWRARRMQAEAERCEREARICEARGVRALAEQLGIVPVNFWERDDG